MTLTTEEREKLANYDGVVRARNYAMRQRDEERAAKEGNIRALNAALAERDALASRLAAVEALATEWSWLLGSEPGANDVEIIEALTAALAFVSAPDNDKAER